MRGFDPLPKCFADKIVFTTISHIVPQTRNRKKIDQLVQLDANRGYDPNVAPN